MLIIPNLMVTAYREKYKRYNLIGGNINKSFIQSKVIVRCLYVFASLIFAMIIYGFFNKNTKKCVAE
jgi:hypothetical protein